MDVVMEKRVLYISYDGMTDPLGQSQVLPYLAVLSKKGYLYHLISFEKKENYAQRKEEIDRYCKTSGIKWHPLTYTSKPPVASTIYDIATMIRKAVKLHRKQNFDIVHCRSYISALAGQYLKKNYGVKMLFDMRGFWADERVDGGLWNLKNPIFLAVYKYFKTKEKEFLIESDHIITLTQRAKDEILSWKLNSLSPSKISVIPCCVNLDLFNPTIISEKERYDLRQMLNLKVDDYILGYVGSVGTWYMLDEMLLMFKHLKAQNQHAKFLFVTGEPKENIIQNATEIGINQDDIIITSASHSKVPLHIALFDLSVFFIKPTYSKMASSPTKQGEIMAMGVPLVCNAGVGDTDAIVNKYKSGMVLQSLSDESLSTVLSFTNQFNQELTLIGAREFFGLSHGAQCYEMAYQSMLD
jgi:glycosyltransferase involved in cell wall biosynthesis